MTSNSDRGVLRRLAGQLIRERFGGAKRKRKRVDHDGRQAAALIFGAGALPGIGAAAGLRVAQGGLPVYLAGRNLDKLNASAQVIRDAGGQAEVLQVDARDADAIDAAFKRVDADGYAVDLVVHNVGTNRPRQFLELKPEHLERSWEADCLSGFLIAQGALARMLPRGRGTLLFTGASASLRGKAGFGSFAASKAGLRMLAQSLAREYSPQGIHVAHVIVDGMVDGQRLRDALPGLLDDAGEDKALDTAAIAETYWQLYQQPRSTWTHELDLRPASEPW